MEQAKRRHGYQLNNELPRRRPAVLRVPVGSGLYRCTT